MSNTSNVTPYASTTTSASTPDNASAGIGLGAACVGAVLGAAAVVRWLAEKTPEEQAALDRYKQERQREALGRPTEIAGRQSELPNVTSVNLHLKDPASLIQSAEKLGYRLETLAAPAATLSATAPILLQSSAGERLAIERNSGGRLVLHTAGERRQVQQLVRQHTLDRAIEHLKGRGMEVRTATLANGEVQILANEQYAGTGGAAQIKAQVRNDGSAFVDVDKLKGQRCAEIVNGLAQAVGGEVTDTNWKDAYFQLPGEPTKTRVKA